MLRTNYWAAVCLAGVFSLLLNSGCGPKQNGASSAGRTGNDPSSGAAVIIKGSDTMVHLVTAWADDFMKAHPDAKISVTGGGSGTGVAALLNGTTDICASSRDLSEEERKMAESKGLNLSELTVAQDALSIVVNPANPVDELTLDQIASIYTGNTTNWKDFGGDDAKIVVASRESSSGTYTFFQEHVLKKRDYAASALLLPATSAIVQTVADAKGAIGYVGLGYAAEAGAKIKNLKVKAAADAPAVAPSNEAVLDGTYSVSRPLYLVVSKAPTGKVKDFLDFCFSEAGQKIVVENGYVKAH